MHKSISLTLLAALFLGSCAPAQTPSTQPPFGQTHTAPATATQTVLPSRTPIPTQTIIPTSTPYPPLQTDGPYLLFTYDDQNSPLKNFTIMDADGSGRKQFRLPNNGYTFQLNKSVSPDGKRLAYFTGSTEEPYDIALNLFNLSDESTLLISNLLSEVFPANLEPIIETMDPLNYSADCFEDMECRSSLVERELIDSLYSLDWSPDSQSIAFTAQIDGPSSDIYIYSVEDRTVRRLTNELQNIFSIQSIHWAPNGQRILYEISSPPGNNSEANKLHLVNLEGLEIPFTDRSVYEYLHWYDYDWVSENLFLLFRWSDAEPYLSDFKILNTDTGQVKDIWPYSAETFAIDHENKAVYLSFKHYYDPSSLPAEGTYIVDTHGNFRKISDEQFVLTESRGSYQVLGQDYERRVYDLNYDGSIELLAWSGYPFPLISPDEKFLLYREHKKLALYAVSYQPIKSWQIEDDIYRIVWRPDSLGLFIFTSKNTYYLSIPDGEPRSLLEDCSPKQCEFLRFIWLP